MRVIVAMRNKPDGRSWKKISSKRRVKSKALRQTCTDGPNLRSKANEQAMAVILEFGIAAETMVHEKLWDRLSAARL